MPTRPPNILWLMPDQMRGDCLGCDGHRFVRTPHLDALAARGMRFSRAFVQGPICAPSRTSWLTSRYVRSHGAWWNGIPHRDGISTLPELLRANGYETAQIGKLHFWPQAGDHGFDRRERHEESLPRELSDYDAFLSAHGQKDPYAATTWSAARERRCPVGVCEMPEELEETRWVADRVADFLARPHQRPFFCFASFIRPHAPFNPLRRFLAPYLGLPIEAPPFDPAEWDRVPARVRDIARAFGCDRHLPEDWREVRRHYYALCSQVDDSVGRILAALARAGRAEDTIVVVSSDHGEFAGEHGVSHKMHLWDGSLRVPLIVAGPGVGVGVRDCLAESIDLAPTLLDLAGLPRPDDFEGRSLVAAMRDTGVRHREEVFAEYVHHSVAGDGDGIASGWPERNSVGVRTREWKYIHYVDEDGELYDLRRDPLERDNRYRDPQLESVRVDLQRRLLSWQMRFASCGFAQPAPGQSYFRNVKSVTAFGRRPPPATAAVDASAS